MNDVLVPLLLFMGAALLLGVGGGVMQRWERPLVWLSLVAHGLSAVAIVLLTKYFFGGGDMLAYHQHGVTYSEVLSSAYDMYAADFVRYALGQKTERQLFMSGSATGAMFGVSTWLAIPLGGSLYGACMGVAMCGVFSKYMLYRGLSLALPARFQREVLVACMLLPSMVFWTSGLLKESMAMLGLGPLCLGSAMLIQGHRRVAGALFALLGGAVITVFKPYVLFPWVVACGVWLYWHRSLTMRGAVRLLSQPFYIVLAFAVAFGGIVLLGELFPRYSLSRVSEEIAQLQTIGQRISGGSNYALGAPARSASAQVALLPMGLVFALFRPLPFEARNLALLLNVAEMLVVLGLWVRMFRARPWRVTFRALMSSPVLVAALVFVVLFGAIVGIATSNVGTLSRYRIPMMPFYLMLLLVLGSPKLLQRPTWAQAPQAR